MLCQPPPYFTSLARRVWGGIKLRIGIGLQILKCSDNHCKYRLRLSLRGRFDRGNLIEKIQDCGACSESAKGGEESRSGLLRLRLATSLAMTILIAGFGKLFTILWFGRSQWYVLLKGLELFTH